MTDSTPTPTPGTVPDKAPDKVEADTVEAVVRQQLSKALGGRRGMAEAAVPTILFTVTWLTHATTSSWPCRSASARRWCCSPSVSCSARRCSS